MGKGGGEGEGKGRRGEHPLMRWAERGVGELGMDRHGVEGGRGRGRRRPVVSAAGEKRRGGDCNQLRRRGEERRKRGGKSIFVLHGRMDRECTGRGGENGKREEPEGVPDSAVVYILPPPFRNYFASTTSADCSTFMKPFFDT